MTDQPTKNLRGEVADLLADAAENIAEMQMELPAFDNIEHVRAIQHANRALIHAGEAFLHAWSTRNYMNNVLSDYDDVQSELDNRNEADVEEYARLLEVERQHQTNSIIIENMKRTMKGLKTLPRVIEVPRS